MGDGLSRSRAPSLRKLMEGRAEKCCLKYPTYSKLFNPHTPSRRAKIKNTGNSKCWHRCRVTGCLTYCWWKRHRLQPLWQTAWWRLRKRSIRWPQDPKILLLRIHPREMETCISTETSTWLFTVAFIHKSPKLETSPMPLDRWVVKSTAAQQYNGMSLSNERESTTDTRNNTDVFWMHCA